MASNNEIVISFKGELFRDTQCSSRLRHPSLTCPQGRLTTRKKLPGRREVICYVTGLLIHNELWTLHSHQWTSHSHLWSSNLYPVALKNQKYVFCMSQMHQCPDLGKPKCCCLAISRSHSYTPCC